MESIIHKIKEAGLVGRGGAACPTDFKWEALLKASGEKKYIICNGSEGEPGVMKDGYILEHYPEDAIEGIRIALQTFENSSAYIYLRKDYYDKYHGKLEKIIGNLAIKVFREPGGYLCGEETTLLESIEGQRYEPRLKPPYPAEKGLFGFPTLVNNLETFYHIAKIESGEYQKTRFYSLSGDISNPGVYEYPEDWTVENILRETKNLPAEKFFAQIGGGASGKIITDKELKEPVGGTGAIIVHDWDKTDPYDLMKQWINFYFNENCGKCTPCREGVYRIREILERTEVEIKGDTLRDILFVLNETSFCPLGKSVAIPFEGLLEKIYKI